MGDYTLEQALAMASESADNASDDAIHVNIDTREVTVPESQKLFGVESDADVEVKHIVIDGRYADGNRDLSKLAWRVIYRNANKDTSYYLIPSVVANENSIEMDWLIKRSVVAYKGTVDFILCAFATTSSGEVTPEWNSTLGQGYALEGLEVSAIDIGKEAVDELAKILNETIAARDIAKAAAKTATDVQASIPADYTQLSTDVSQLKEDTAKLKDGKISKFYASSQGDTNLPDSDNGRIVDLKLYGKSEQKQYSGKNLFPPVTYSGNVSNLQIDAADGAVHLKGTPNDQVNSAIIGAWSASSPTIFTLPAGTYTLSGFGEWLSTPRLNLVYVENGELISLSGNKTVTFDKETNFIAVFVYANANAALDITFKPMIEKGSTATAYEPYVGGIPSPNPEYPQEIKSVVNPVVKVTGQNYLNYKDVGGGVTAPVTLAKGDHYLTRFFLTANEEINNGVEYLRDETWARINTLGSLENGKIVVSDSTFGWYSKHMKITCTENITIRVATTDTCAITLNDYGYLDKYAEYQAPQTVTLPYTLNAIPVTSGGNVTIDGQQYIADYVDVERGKLVRMTARKNLFDLNIWPWGDPTETRADFQANIERYDSDTFKFRSIPCIVSSLSKDSKIEFPSFSYTTTGNSGWDGYAKLAIYVSKIYDTVDKLKSYLGEDTVVLYQLKDPIETDLTADEIAAFKSLASYYPVTNVSTTSDQLGGYTVFDYPISLANGWNYVKQQLGDTRDYLYGIDLMTAEAYVNSEYAAALAEIEV